MDDLFAVKVFFAGIHFVSNFFKNSIYKCTKVYNFEIKNAKTE